MGHPNSYFGRNDIKDAITNSASPEEFYEKVHWLDSYKGGWMDKAFWTIKKNPEFRWDQNRSYVEKPFNTKFSDFVKDVTLSRSRPFGERKVFLSTERCEPYRKSGPFIKIRGKTEWVGQWVSPTDLLLELWKERVCSNPFASDFGIGGLELVKWPESEGCVQKYLLLGNHANHIGSMWIAMLTEINIPVIESEENNEKHETVN